MPDDLDLNVVRSLRADVPEMSERAFAEGRAQLVAATGGKGVVPRRQARRQPFRGRLLPVAAAATVAIAGAGVAAVSLTGDEAKAPVAETGPESRVLPPMPAEPLNRAGELADRVTDIPPQPGQYLYLEETGWISGEAPEEPTRTWVPKNRAAEWLRIIPSGDEIRAEGGFESAGDVLLPSQSTFERLPRDPKALYEFLRREVRYRADQATAMFENIVRMLDGSTPAPLRAGLYRVLGHLPHVAIAPGAFTEDGRPAISVEMPWVDGRRSTEALVAPDTGLVIGHRGQGKESEGTVRYAVVDRMGQVPPA
ncbi:CU044_5270 family protein [Amycolatopsis cihanbeyliensis]|uniref:CU044_5270 family protein n=1 Tax=Amycolatopsis cihanbeyliensis TaxID=1128664 RepID=A0A542DNB8_AMYCI|nr:CU044_5270 family protein [Amycolatopsis cihanbeyliensis]TQJ04583.1 hypothetical protein FB471_4383 [Amycolatopsis cihanbeyliensis]